MTQTVCLSGVAGKTFDGVIFDMDQTLVDSLPAINRSWDTWSRHYNIPRVTFEGMFGMPADSVIALTLPPELHAEALDMIHGLEIKDVEGILPLPGAAEALAELPGERVAIATSAIERLMLARLCASGLPLPAVWVTRDMVARGKPSPDIFLLAAERLGIEPARALVVEDAPAGIEAAKAAGMPSLAVLTTSSAEDLRADAVISTLADVAWRCEDGVITVVPR